MKMGHYCFAAASDSPRRTLMRRNNADARKGWMRLCAGVGTVAANAATATIIKDVLMATALPATDRAWCVIAMLRFI